MTAEPRAERAEPRPASPARTAALMLVLFATLVAAIVSWFQVVTALRGAIPLETRGTPAAIVWSDRVFRSEAEFARWLRGRGISYERWVRTHPQAVAILRKRDRPAALDAPERKAAARSRQSPVALLDDDGAQRVSRAWSVVAVAALLATTLVFLAVLVAALRESRARRRAA